MSRRRVVRAVVTEADNSTRTIAPAGRDAQTLTALVYAGPIGITALDIAHWAVRLSHYIFKLRHVYGLDIAMVEEMHGGDYPGRHGRYVLRSQVRLIAIDDEHGRAA